ncbi:MAG TPA: hypothetical protein PLK12_14470, partial [Prolixibacteraceae bacterium]|nr:hypothetical protein [Prolixibacteraceae bacterium]
QKEGIPLARRNFTICYRSDIPLRLGLAGSSAIITAAMKALMQFYEVNIPRPVMANLVLSVEVDQLGISAGLQDRVAQAYEHPVFMDFNRALMERQGYGDYRMIDPKLLPPIYIAYRSDQSQGSEVTHNNLKARFVIGEQVVLAAMEEWARLTIEFLDAMEQKDVPRMHRLINRNYDLRESLIEITEENKEMVRLARSLGVSAKFTGSGGAIIGLFDREEQFFLLKERFREKEIEVIRPDLVFQQEDPS